MFAPGKLYQPGLVYCLCASRAHERLFSRIGFYFTNKHWTKLERLARDEHSSLLQTFLNYARKSFLTLGPGTCTVKLITAVIYGFRNMVERLSLNTRLDWKGLPATNTLAYYGNRKFQP